MRKLFVIGIGAGDPDHITMQAINALNEVDVFFAFDKGSEKEDLLNLRREICERFIKDRRYRFVEISNPERDTQAGYAEGVRGWHQARAALLASAMAREMREDERGAVLVWGDPSLYDSTLRVIEHVLASGVAEFEIEVIPGITSVQALAARHRTVLNAIGGAVHITTGRKLAEGLPRDADSVVVMLDSGAGLEALARDDDDDNNDIHIYWGAYLGTPDEVLVSGKLCEVLGEIERIRASRKAAKGWIMDTYLLRRAPRP